MLHYVSNTSWVPFDNGGGRGNKGEADKSRVVVNGHAYTGMPGCWPGGYTLVRFGPGAGILEHQLTSVKVVMAKEGLGRQKDSCSLDEEAARVGGASKEPRHAKPNSTSTPMGDRVMNGNQRHRVLGTL